MFFNSLINRELGFQERLHDIYAEKCVANLCCHNGNVFSCTSKDFVNNGLEVPPFVARFSPLSPQKEVLLVASEDGEVFVHRDFDSLNNDAFIKINAHDNAIFDICWMNDANSFVTVSGDKTAALWDLHSRTKISQFCGDQGSIKTVDVRPEDNAVFATGGRKGNIMLWDTRSVGRNQSCYVVNVLRDVHNVSEPAVSKRTKYRAKSDTSHGVTSVLFQDNNTLISAGAKDGDIKFWDIRRTYSAYRNVPLPCKKIPYVGSSLKQGFTSLTLDDNGGRLFASCTDSIIYEYNCSSCKLINKYSGHRNSSFYVKSTLSPQNDYLLSGSSDEYAYIWKVGESEKPIFRLDGHSDEVTSVAWSKSDNSKIVTCCDDMKYRVWSNSLNETHNQSKGQVERVENSDVENCSTISRTPNNIVSRPFTSAATLPTYQSPLQEIKLNFNRTNALSPTINLPNFVLDKPTTPINSSRSTPRRPSNWLTKITDSHKSKQTNVSRSAQKLKKSRSRTRIDKCLENYFTFI